MITTLRVLCLILLVAERVSGDAKSSSLENHNFHRKNAGLIELVWDEKLEDSAEKWAKDMGDKYQCKSVVRSGQPVIGENLFHKSVADKDEKFEAEEVAKAALQDWYAQVLYYRYAGVNSNYLSCNWAGSTNYYTHYPVQNFTNIMWEGTQKVGCGGYDCENGNYVYVCHYSPLINANKPLFNDTSFLSLCKNEPGVYRSCWYRASNHQYLYPDSLQTKCDTEALNKAIGKEGARGLAAGAEKSGEAFACVNKPSAVTTMVTLSIALFRM